MLLNLMSNPKKIFLIDAFGAILTVISVGFILPHYENLFGMPSIILHYLAGIAGIYFIYSLLCYVFIIRNISSYLKIIITLNLLYCILTAVLIILKFKELTYLGFTYFFLEIVVIFVIIFIEIKTLKRF